MGKSLEENRHRLPRILSQWSHMWCAWFPQQQVLTTCVKCCLPWKIVRDPEPMGFTRGWSHRDLLLSMNQNSRLPEEKQMFSMNHIVYTNSLGIVGTFISFVVGEPSWGLSSQVPVKGQPCKQSFLRIAISSLLCLFFAWHAIKVNYF